MDWLDQVPLDTQHSDLTAQPPQLSGKSGNSITDHVRDWWRAVLDKARGQLGPCHHTRSGR
jgi:hypothetical protein